MVALPNDWFALLLMVFLLGLKHGLDPDHLATIDGLTRFNASARPRLARCSGLLFSLGHGAVVTAVAVLIGVYAKQWEIPSWLESLGTWISIVFLLGLGVANIAALRNTGRNRMVRPVGLKGRWSRGFTEISHPGLIALIGALFALSFDTISQAALFSLTASAMAGWMFAGTSGIVFMLGMIATDGVNGLWIAKLLRRADQRAVAASRVMSLTIAGLSLLIAAFGAAKYFFPKLAASVEGQQLIFGLAVVGVVALSFVVALRLASPKKTSESPAIQPSP
jgi:nickel/cobalt transporter (NiCoT) family protein